MEEREEMCPEEACPEDAISASSDLEAEVIKERELAEEHRSRLLRLQADFDNYRKRVQRQQALWREDAVSELGSALLPVIDDLERAVCQEDDGAALREGVRLVHRRLLDVLEGYQIRPIQAVGQRFDPNYHEALMQVETQDHPDGSVVEDLRRGYVLGERLLRPSAVRVAHNPQGGQNDDKEVDEQ